MVSSTHYQKYVVEFIKEISHRNYGFRNDYHPTESCELPMIPALISSAMIPVTSATPNVGYASSYSPTSMGTRGVSLA